MPALPVEMVPGGGWKLTTRTYFGALFGLIILLEMGGLTNDDRFSEPIEETFKLAAQPYVVGSLENSKAQMLDKGTPSDSKYPHIVMALQNHIIKGLLQQPGKEVPDPDDVGSSKTSVSHSSPYFAMPVKKISVEKTTERVPTKGKPDAPTPHLKQNHVLHAFVSQTAHTSQISPHNHHTGQLHTRPSEPGHVRKVEHFTTENGKSFVSATAATLAKADAEASVADVTAARAMHSASAKPANRAVLPARAKPAARAVPVAKAVPGAARRIPNPADFRSLAESAAARAPDKDARSAAARTASGGDDDSALIPDKLTKELSHVIRFAFPPLPTRCHSPHGGWSAAGKRDPPIWGAGQHPAFICIPARDYPV